MVVASEVALALDSLQQALGDHGVDTAWHGTREPFEFAQQLRKLTNVDTGAFNQTAIPRGLKAMLRPYQRAGLGWLNAIATDGLSPGKFLSMHNAYTGSKYLLPIH